PLRREVKRCCVSKASVANSRSHVSPPRTDGRRRYEVNRWYRQQSQRELRRTSSSTVSRKRSICGYTARPHHRSPAHSCPYECPRARCLLHSIWSRGRAPPPIDRSRNKIPLDRRQARRKSGAVILVSNPRQMGDACSTLRQSSVESPGRCTSETTSSKNSSLRYRSIVLSLSTRLLLIPCPSERSRRC